MEKRPHRFVLRLPPPLHQRIAEAAGLYRRSMNAEIVARLEYSLSGVHAEAENAVTPALFPYIEMTFRGHLSEEENALIDRFRRLSESQRAGLIALLGG